MESGMRSKVASLSPIVNSCLSVAATLRDALNNDPATPSAANTLLTIYASFKNIVENVITHEDKEIQISSQVLEEIRQHVQPAEKRLQNVEAQLSRPRWRQVIQADPLLDLEDILHDAMTTEARLFLFDGNVNLGIQLGRIEDSLRELMLNPFRARVGPPTPELIERKLCMMISAFDRLLDDAIGEEECIQSVFDFKGLLKCLISGDNHERLAAQSSLYVATDSQEQKDTDEGSSERAVNFEELVTRIDRKFSLVRDKITSSMESDADRHLVKRMLSRMIAPWSLRWKDIELQKISTCGFLLPDVLSCSYWCIVYRGKLQLDRHGRTNDSVIDVAVRCLLGSPVHVRSSFVLASNTLFDLRHPCIVDYYGSYWPPEEGNSQWHQPLILLELMGGSLIDFRSRIEPGKALIILRDVAEAVTYLHSRGLFQLCLCPQNVMLKIDEAGQLSGRAKIVGFNSSKPRIRSVVSDSGLLCGMAFGGVLEFMAPEVRLGGESSGKSSDVWSYGALMCWLFGSSLAGSAKCRGFASGAVASTGASNQDTMGERWLHGLGDNTPACIRDLAKKCLMSDPEERPCMREVFIALEFQVAGIDPAWIAKLGRKSADVLFETGMGLLFGVDCARNVKEAGQWLMFAGDLGSADALYVLREAFEQNSLGVEDIVPKEDIEIIGDIHRVVKSDCSEGRGFSMWFLSMYYRLGVEVQKNLDRAVNLLEGAVKCGNICAAVDLGHMYLVGEGVNKDAGRGVELLEKAAECDKIRAQEGLGLCFTKGEGVVKDLTRAKAIFRQAVDAGSTSAHEHLKRLEMDGAGEESESSCTKPPCSRTDPKQEVADTDDDDDDDDETAAFERGKALYDGGREYSAALKYLQKAADGGHLDAQFYVGECYFYGRGVAKDWRHAVEWFEEAANEGHVEAQYQLGKCYAWGLGVDSDLDCAAQWFQDAADAGHRIAQCLLPPRNEDGGYEE